MKRHAVRGALWLIPAKAICAGLHFVGIFVLARHYLDRYEVGLAALVLAVTGLLAAGADLGMGVLSVSRERADDRQAARWAGLGGLLCFAATVLGAPLIARLLDAPAGFVPLLQAGAFALLLAGVISSARARLTRALSFRAIALVDVAVAATATAGRIGLATQGYGAWSIVLGDVMGAIVASALVWLLAPRMQAGDRTPMFADGLRLVGARAADSGFAQADRFLIARFLGAGSLGLYAFSWQHAMVAVQQLSPVAEQIALPIFSRMQRDKPALAAAYLGLTRVFALIVVPFAGLLFLAAPWLVGLLYPERWQDAIPIVRALCVAAAASGLNSQPGIVWVALGDTRLRMRWSIVNLAAIVFIIAAGLPYGAVGVAYALAARSLLATVIAQVITRRKAGVRHGDYARALLPGAAIGAGFFLLGLLV